MAGIGFTLQKALDERSQAGPWRVYGAAAFVAAGPWLLTLLALFLVLAWGWRQGLGPEWGHVFLATVTYAMIGSNLIVMTGQFFFTRYLADALYVRAYERLLSAFVGMWVYTSVGALVLSSVYQYFVALPLAYRVWTVLLTVVLTQLGLLMVLLSAAKAYREIAAGFLSGLLCLLMALGAYGYWRSQYGAPVDATSLLALFTLSQAVALLLLGGVAVRDFPGHIPVLYAMAPHYRRYPELLWIGLGYGLTLWIDNALYWASADHLIVADSYVLAPAYDMAKFWTFLALIPACTVFTVHVETAFYTVFRQFYEAIESGATLASLRLLEEALRTATRAALVGMAKIQAGVALLAWVLSQQLASSYTAEVRIVQWTIIGSVPHLVWITALLFLLYFDARKQALRAVGLVLLSLCAGTWVAMHCHWAPGTGFLLGSMLASIVTLYLLRAQLRRLLFYAFHDPNGGTKDSLPPATRATERQTQAGYPVLAVMLATVTLGALSGGGATAAAEEATSLVGCKSFTIFYGSPTAAAITVLRAYSLVVIEPRLWSPAQVQMLKKSGTKVHGYLSVLEQYVSSPLLAQARPDDYLVINGQGRFRAQWQSWSMDINSGHYQSLLLADYEQQIVHKGLHGVFLDTVGNVDDAMWNKAVSDAQRDGVVQFIASLRAQYPTRSIIQNRGLTQLKDRTAPYIDGLLWEDFFSHLVRHDQWSQERMQELGALQARGIAVFTSAVGLKGEQKRLFEQLNRQHGYVGQVIKSSYDRL